MSKLEPTRTYSNPTAAEILRRMLDERGVKWEAFDDFEPTTQWSTHNGAFVYWARERDGKLLVETTAPTKCSASCTPEQAIAATLGSCNRSYSCTNSERTGTCHNAAPSYLDFLCSGCGFVHYHSDTNDTGDGNEWCFCPNCGARVAEPTTNDVDVEVSA